MNNKIKASLKFIGRDNMPSLSWGFLLVASLTALVALISNYTKQYGSVNNINYLFCISFIFAGFANFKSDYRYLRQYSIKNIDISKTLILNTLKMASIFSLSVFIFNLVCSYIFNYVGLFGEYFSYKYAPLENVDFNFVVMEIFFCFLLFSIFYALGQLIATIFYRLNKVGTTIFVALSIGYYVFFTNYMLSISMDKDINIFGKFLVLPIIKIIHWANTNIKLLALLSLILIIIYAIQTLLLLNCQVKYNK